MEKTHPIQNQRASRIAFLYTAEYNLDQIYECANSLWKPITKPDILYMQNIII